MPVSHTPKSGATLTGAEYEAVDHHVIALDASDIPAHSHAGEDISSGTVADGRVASTLARDSEVTSAISTHEAAGDPHPGYLTTAEGNAAYQPVDSDLTTIGGLSPNNDDIIQRKAGAWANRTIAQLLTDLAAPGTTFQPLDSDLTAIAALTTTAFGRGLLAEASAATTRATLDLEAGTDFPALATFNDHSARHESGGADAIRLDDLAATEDNTDLNASTSAHGLMQKYPGGTTTFLRGDGSFATPTAEASVTFTAFTQDLGASDRAGTFDITGLSGLAADKTVMVMQTAAAIASKGNARDEPEMDQIQLTGYVVDATTIRCYWQAPSVVVGTYAFAYLVGA